MVDAEDGERTPGSIVLGVHRITADGADYYLADLAHELPLPSGTREGRADWCGCAADGLGLNGALDPEKFRAVLDGRHPTTAHRLRSSRTTVAGYDLTFSAPKSASVLFALGGRDVAHQVLAAHHETAWPGLIAGVAAATLAQLTARPVLEGASARLQDNAARFAVTLYADAAALLLALAAWFAPPLSILALAFFASLLWVQRGRALMALAGLRVSR